MFRRIISLITLTALLVNTVGLTGCTKIVNVPVHETSATENGTDNKAVRGSIVAIHTKDSVILFAGHAEIDSSSNAVVGYTPHKEYVSIPLDDVISFEVKRPHMGTFKWVAGIHLVSFFATFIFHNNSSD